MDIKSLNDVQKQLFQRLIEKLIARNKCPPNEIENMQKLLENVRDTKNFQKIMEKLKECGQIELDNIEDDFKEGGKKSHPQKGYTLEIYFFYVEIQADGKFQKFYKTNNFIFVFVVQF